MDRPPPTEEVFAIDLDERGGPEPRLDRPAHRRPILFVTLAFMAGMIVGRSVLLPLWSLMGAATLLLAILVFQLTRAEDRLRSVPGATRILFAILILLGWAGSNRAIRIDRSAEGIAEEFSTYELVRAQGWVAEAPRRTDKSVQLVLKDVELSAAPRGSASAAFPLKLLVSIFQPPYGPTRIEPERIPRHGQSVVVWGRISIPAGKTHPLDFDSARYQNGRGIGAVLNVRSTDDIEPGPRSAVPLSAGLFSWLQTARDSITRNIRRSLSPEGSSIALALSLGDRSGLSDEVRENLIRSGLAHIFSVSGLHTGFILLIGLALARAAGLPPRACALVGALVLLFYLFLVGFRPPVVRAALLGWFVLGGWALGRSASILGGLAVAALVTLAWDARNLVRPDWQLSYACVASITLLAPAVYQMFTAGWKDRADGGDGDGRGNPPLARFVRSYVAIPMIVVLAILIGLLPLQAAYFHRFSLVALVSNLVAVPMAFLVVLGSAILGLTGWIEPLAGLVGVGLDGLIGIFTRTVAFFGSLPLATIRMTPLAPWMIGVYYAVFLWGPHLRPPRGVLGLSEPRQRWHMALRVGLFAAALLWLPLLTGASHRSGELELYALDVGQGDCLILRFPDGKIGLIDAGNSESKARLRIAPFLEWLGARRLDFVVATHADADHIGGLAYLVENFEVGLFITGPDRADSIAYAELMRALGRKKIHVHQAHAGEKIRGARGVEIEVLSPAGAPDGNNASVVLLIDYGEIEILLTGDIERPAEKRILARGAARDVDVLKVAHHGSATSTSEAFLDAFKPEIAIVSAGRNNRFGHPSPIVVGRLTDHGATIARTDLLGTLQLRTDGRRMALYRYGD